MELIDTHCHLDVEDFDPDREDVLDRCRQAGIRHIIIPAVSSAGWDKLQRLAEKDNSLHYALGLHPMYVQQHKPEDLGHLEDRLADSQAIAVGEIGLDFYIKDPDREKQKSYFEAQLTLAKQFDLPVILHVRKAHDDVLACLKKIGVKGGIAHAFNGSLQQAERYVEMGFKLGFGGMLTYERSSKLRALARQLPMEVIVLETDAPDMTVAAHRGERNSPEYLTDCLNALAHVRDASPEYIAEQTTLNAQSVFGVQLQ